MACDAYEFMKINFFEMPNRQVLEIFGSSLFCQLLLFSITQNTYSEVGDREFEALLTHSAAFNRESEANVIKLSYIFSREDAKTQSTEPIS
jgi:hypothetical protein